MLKNDKCSELGRKINQQTLVFISVTQGDNERVLGDNGSVNPEKNETYYAWGKRVIQ